MNLNAGQALDVSILELCAMVILSVFTDPMSTNVVCDN